MLEGRWLKRDVLRLLEDAGINDYRRLYSDKRIFWRVAKVVPPEVIVIGSAFLVALDFLETFSVIALLSVDKGGKAEPRISACLTTAAAMANDGASIATLCREGFDVQARGLLRVFIEKGDLLLSVLYDDDLAQAYVGDSSFEGSRAFFFNRISKGKLKKTAQAHFCRSMPEMEIHEWLYGEWRENIDLMVGAAVHPNHTVAFISLFPNVGRGGSNAVGFGGYPNRGSVRTILECFTAILPLALLTSSDSMPPFQLGKAYINDDKVDNLIDKMRRLGKFVVSVCYVQGVKESGRTFRPGR